MGESSSQRRTLVTGAGGFVGGYLVGALLGRGLDVRAVDRRPLGEWQQLHPGAESVVADLAQAESCRAVCAGIGQVFNLAADMGGIGFIEANKAACMLSVLISTQMLLAAREAGASRFFFSSSACVYPLARQGSSDVAPLREADAYPALPEDGYGWEKLFGERMCRHFREEFGLQTRVARYHNVYGPHSAWRGGREKAPAAVCRKVAEAALSGGEEIEIWGDGHQTRSFAYIDDCVRGTLLIAGGEHPEPVNLGSSELVSIDELVSVVEEIAGVKLRRRYRPEAVQGVRGRNSENTLIRELYGWEPSIGLREGLEATYAWVAEQVERELRLSGAG